MDFPGTRAHRSIDLGCWAGLICQENHSPLPAASSAISSPCPGWAWNPRTRYLPSRPGLPARGPPTTVHRPISRSAAGLGLVFRGATGARKVTLAGPVGQGCLAGWGLPGRKSGGRRLGYWTVYVPAVSTTWSRARSARSSGPTNTQLPDPTSWLIPVFSSNEVIFGAGGKPGGTDGAVLTSAPRVS